MNDPARLLSVRDRPWTFWSGVGVVFLALGLLAMHPLLPDRDRDVKNMIFWVDAALLAAGLALCWRGRALRFDPHTKALSRDGVAVRDLSATRAIVLHPLFMRSSTTYYVIAFIGPAGARPHQPEIMHPPALAALQQVGLDGTEEVFALVQGMPRGFSTRRAQAFADALDAPLLALDGELFTF